MSNNVVVLGSINVDTTYHVDRFPQPGETISAVSKSSAPGGKGANQAVACLNHWLMIILIHATS